MQISELARRTSVSVHALRHYERLGLLQPQRLANGYRDYPQGMQREVVFIAMSRQLGFGLPQIARHLAEYRNGALRVDDMVAALQERAAALAQQIAELTAQQQQVIDHQAWLRAQQLRQEQQQEQKQKQQQMRNATPGSGAPPWPRARPAGAAAARLLAPEPQSAPTFAPTRKPR